MTPTKTFLISEQEGDHSEAVTFDQIIGEVTAFTDQIGLDDYPDLQVLLIGSVANLQINGSWEPIMTASDIDIAILDPEVVFHNEIHTKMLNCGYQFVASRESNTRPGIQHMKYISPSGYVYSIELFPNIPIEDVVQSLPEKQAVAIKGDGLHPIITHEMDIETVFPIETEPLENREELFNTLSGLMKWVRACVRYNRTESAEAESRKIAHILQGLPDILLEQYDPFLDMWIWNQINKTIFYLDDHPEIPKDQRESSRTKTYTFLESSGILKAFYPVTFAYSYSFLGDGAPSNSAVESQHSFRHRSHYSNPYTFNDSSNPTFVASLIGRGHTLEEAWEISTSSTYGTSLGDATFNHLGLNSTTGWERSVYLNHAILNEALAQTANSVSFGRTDLSRIPQLLDFRRMLLTEHVPATEDTFLNTYRGQILERAEYLMDKHNIQERDRHLALQIQLALLMLFIRSSHQDPSESLINEIVSDIDRCRAQRFPHLEPTEVMRRDIPIRSMLSGVFYS